MNKYHTIAFNLLRGATRSTSLYSPSPSSFSFFIPSSLYFHTRVNRRHAISYRCYSTQSFVYRYAQVLQASELGDVKTVKEKIEESSNRAEFFQGNNFTPLHVAAQKGNMELATTLLELGYPVDIPNKDETTPLYIASGNGRFEVAKFLIAKGAKIEVKGKNGNTPLLNAARMGHLDIFNYLFSKGGKVESTTVDGTTALLYACAYGHIEIVKRILEISPKELEVKMESNHWTALLGAVAYKQTKIVSLLLDKGANVEATDNMGYTPLMIACEAGSEDIVEELIKRGANVNATNTTVTPLMLATLIGNQRIIKAIKGAGGSDNLPPGVNNIMQNGKVIGFSAGPKKGTK